jgi:capping protein alpha
MEDMQSKIRKYIIKSCPVGETKDVFVDLSKLFPSFNPEDPEVLAVMKDFNEEHLVLAKGENNLKYVVSQTGAQENFYIDQRNNQRHFVNHLEAKITASEPLEMVIDETIKIYRDEIEKKILKYKDDYYKEQDFGVFVYGEGTSDQFSFYVAISAKNLNFKNFYGGEWLSEWRITKNSLIGKIRINAHFFEDGNVQLKEIKNIEEKLGLIGNDPIGESAYVVELIEKLETKLQTGLDVIYENMPDQFFKAMRRILPFTNTKMEWNAAIPKVIGALKQ